MSINQWATRVKNPPYLVTPPLFSLLRNKWRNRDRVLPNIPDHQLYQPVYYPWLGGGAFGKICSDIAAFSLVSPDRLWVLYSAAKNAALLPGVMVECGVYKGGTAYLLARVATKHLHLFDSFSGMPKTNSTVDKHQKGDFSDTSLAMVKRNVGDHPNISYHCGYIPDTFSEVALENIALLHIDLDIYDSIYAAVQHCYDKVLRGGFIIFDDYGFESCYGARLAVDAFFKDKPEWPICLPTGQALVIKA